MSERLEKLAKIKSLGINPYPEKFERTHKNAEALKIAEEKGVRETNAVLENPHNEVKLCGRVMTFRSHGKLAFAQLQDVSGRIQLCFVKGKTKVEGLKVPLEKGDLGGSETQGELQTPQPPFQGGVATVGDVKPTIQEEIPAYKFIEKLVDLGDFIGVTGELFKTNHGEITLFVDELKFLGKALRDLPEKWHGVTDQETIYRQRYLDLIMNSKSKDRFMMRSKIIKTIREFMWKHEFMEVETPTLEHGATGAAAKPYYTKNNALDLELVLRISQELPLKKLIVGGYERVFEIGKAFRNEGVDPSHLPEHTHFEWYVAYWSFRENMDYTEKMIRYVFEQLNLNQIVPIKDKDGKVQNVDFSREWERIDYVDLIKKDSGIDILEINDVDSLRRELKKKNLIIEGMETMGYATLVDYLYKKVSRPKIIGPAFLYNYPKALQPLARVNDENPAMVDQFQLVINGWEVVKGYSELVDSVDQNERFQEQEKHLAAGDEEAMEGDDEYIIAMEHGMPPISGVGLGLDRFITLLLEQDNLRDCVLFPLMKPLGTTKDVGKSKETKIAVALINKGLNLEQWQELNTIGHLSSAFGARVGKSLFMQDQITTKDHQKINLNIQHAIMVKEANSNREILDLIKIAKENDLEVAEFTREMIEVTDDRKVVAMTKEKNLSEIEYLGVLLFGKKSLVDALTKQFVLYGNDENVIVHKPENKPMTSGAVDYSDVVLPSRKKAWSLVEKYAEKKSYQHLQMVETAMRTLAKKFNENEDLWGMVGLLHDIDWDLLPAGATKHDADKIREICKEIDLDDLLIEAILAHDPSQGIEADNLLKKAIRSVDEITGFISAVAKVRPDKKLESVKVKSVTKKIKDKSFAANVSREHLKYCEELLDIPVAEFVEILLDGLKAEAGEFGM